MTAKTHFSLILVALALAACGGGNDETAASDETSAVPVSEAVTPKAAPGEVRSPGKASGPFSLRYTIIGAPIVGNPVAIELEVHSALGAVPVELAFEAPDPSAMLLHEAQPAKLQAEFAANERFVKESVTVVPQREGRLFLNVTVSAEVEEGTIATSISIPLHVGDTVAPQEEGELETDEEGETVRVIQSD